MKMVFHVLPFLSLYMVAWFACWMYMKTSEFRKLALRCGVRKSLFLKAAFVISFTPVLNLLFVVAAFGHTVFFLIAETKVNFKRTWKSFED